MAHIHEVIDTDIHYKIDNVTRTITNIDEIKRELVQYDHNSERLTFEIPRYVDGHDFSECNLVQVHYENIDTFGKMKSSDIYYVNDLHVKEDDDQVVVLSWLIKDTATKYVGTLNFVIRFACFNEGVIEYAWNTKKFEGILILPGIYNNEIIEEEHYDIIDDLQSVFNNQIKEKNVVIINQVGNNASLTHAQMLSEVEKGKLLFLNINNRTIPLFQINDKKAIFSSAMCYISGTKGETTIRYDNYTIDSKSTLISNNIDYHTHKYIEKTSELVNDRNFISEEEFDWIPKMDVNETIFFEEQTIVVDESLSDMGGFRCYDLNINQEIRDKLVNEYDSLTVIINGVKTDLSVVTRMEEDGIYFQAYFTAKGSTEAGTIVVGSGKSNRAVILLPIGEYTVKVCHIVSNTEKIPDVFLPDDLLRVEKNIVTFLPDNTYEFNMDMDGMMIYMGQYTGDMPQVDNQYNVIWNGNEYKCKPLYNGGDGTYFLGNAGLMMGGESTGEPFVIALAEGICMIIPLDGSSSANIHCYGEHIKPIEEKLLPETYTLDLSKNAPISTSHVTKYEFNDFDNLKKALHYGNVKVKANLHIDSFTDVLYSLSGNITQNADELIEFYANIINKEMGNYESVYWLLYTFYYDCIIYICIDERNFTGDGAIKAIIKKIAFV